MAGFVDVPLFPDCVLPGCSVPVAEVGQPCDGCRGAFGSMMQPGGQSLTAHDIEVRDRAAERAYARRGFA